MSLFALRREYQRSIDRVFEDFSDHTRAQFEPSPAEVDSDRDRSVISLGNQRERYEQPEIQNDITSRVSDRNEYIHHDIKAWACFLDSKRRA